MQGLRVHLDAGSSSAVADTALSHALLRAVDAGEVPESLRLYRPCDAMAFSVLDRTRAGFGEAVLRARRAGFEPVVRLAGGRAAVFERHALAFAWTVPASDARAGIRARFEVLSRLVARSLCALGVDARVGEVDGEYCPGEYSVNARGAVKLMGVGQRVLRRAAHVGGVIVVRNASRIASALDEVYEALEFPIDPSRTGAVEDEVTGVDADAVADALLAEVAREREIRPEPVPAFVARRATELEAAHAPDAPAARTGARGGAAKAFLQSS